MRSCNSYSTQCLSKITGLLSCSFSVNCICIQILSKSPWERKGKGNIFAFHIFSHCFTKQINSGYHWKDHSKVESICPTHHSVVLVNIFSKCQISTAAKLPNNDYTGQCWEIRKTESVRLATNQLFQFSFTCKNASNLRHELVFLES